MFLLVDLWTWGNIMTTNNLETAPFTYQQYSILGPTDDEGSSYVKKYLLQEEKDLFRWATIVKNEPMDLPIYITCKLIMIICKNFLFLILRKHDCFLLICQIPHTTFGTAATSYNRKVARETVTVCASNDLGLRAAGIQSTTVSEAMN